MSAIYQASKWLKIQTLLESDEMNRLLDAVGAVKLYLVGRVTSPQEQMLAKEAFLQQYGRYVMLLKKGIMPDAAAFRPYFSAALTLSDDHLDRIEIQGDRQLMRVAKPVVQVQLHMMGYSPVDQKFRPMILGDNSIHWGVQFSYPQLYFDPVGKEVLNVFTQDRFPNTRLYRTIQKWIRKNTVPTPFLVGEKKVNVPMRIGKQCFGWINAHPSLRNLGLEVAGTTNKEMTLCRLN